MLDIGKAIQSLSHFKRKTAEVMKRMKKTGNPVLLTINGKAEMVVQDAESYQHLLELAGGAEMMEFLRESREDIEAGRTEPALEALGRLVHPRPGRGLPAAFPTKRTCTPGLDGKKRWSIWDLGKADSRMSRQRSHDRYRDLGRADRGPCTPGSS